MSSWFQRNAVPVGLAVCLSASAQAQTTVSPDTTQAQSATASAPAQKKKRASGAKTPPGKPPRGATHCSQGDKAQQQRCLRDLYGPGAPPV